MRPFQVGDIVIDHEGNLGEVIDIEFHNSYPIYVRFEYWGDDFTLEGRMYMGEEDEGEYIRHLTPLERILL